MTRKEWEAIGKKAGWDSDVVGGEATSDDANLPAEVSIGANNEWVFVLPHVSHFDVNDSADRPWWESQEKLIKDMAGEIYRGSGSLTGDAMIRKIENLLALAKIRSPR